MRVGFVSEAIEERLDELVDARPARLRVEPDASGVGDGVGVDRDREQRQPRDEVGNDDSTSAASATPGILARRRVGDPSDPTEERADGGVRLCRGVGVRGGLEALEAGVARLADELREEPDLPMPGGPTSSTTCWAAGARFVRGPRGAEPAPHLARRVPRPGGRPGRAARRASPNDVCLDLERLALDLERPSLCLVERAGAVEHRRHGDDLLRPCLAAEPGRKIDRVAHHGVGTPMGVADVAREDMATIDAGAEGEIGHAAITSRSPRTMPSSSSPSWTGPRR